MNRFLFCFVFTFLSLLTGCGDDDVESACHPNAKLYLARRDVTEAKFYKDHIVVSVVEKQMYVNSRMRIETNSGKFFEYPSEENRYDRGPVIIDFADRTISIEGIKVEFFKLETEDNLYAAHEADLKSILNNERKSMSTEELKICSVRSASIFFSPTAATRSVLTRSEFYFNIELSPILLSILESQISFPKAKAQMAP